MGHYLVGWVYWQLHDEARALAACDKAIEPDPEYPFGYFQRARVQVRRGQSDEALTDFTRAIELDPNVPMFLLWRAARYSGMNDYDKSIADHKRALELNPDYRSAFRNLAWNYWNAGRRDEARDVAQALSARAATWHDTKARAAALVDIANFQTANGDYELALAEAEKIIDLQPEKLRGYDKAARARRELEGTPAI